MFRIFDGRDSFFQWDLNRRLIVEDNSINEVHFCNKTDDSSLVCVVRTEDGLRVADVPNILLQTDWSIRAYAYCTDHTIVEEIFKVHSRNKPADYIYTETEIKNYDDLKARVDEIERVAADIPTVDSTLTKSGQAADAAAVGNRLAALSEEIAAIPSGADGKSAYQYAQDGGYTGTETEFAAKLAQEKFANPNALTFTGAVAGIYDGSSPLRVEIPSGGGGLSDYKLIDTLDWSTDELAQFGAGKEYSFKEVQDIILVYTGLANDTTIVSGLSVNVNNIRLSSAAEPVSGKSGNPMNGYVFLRAIPGIGLFSLKSPGANSDTNYGSTNANIAYNLNPVTEKITKFEIQNRGYSYRTNMGILKIYVR